MSDFAGLERFAGVRIAVIGDVMLDHHVFGKVDRISPEAPVPVLLVESERRALGGAANVAANIAALGGKALLIGVMGDDLAGADLIRLIEDSHKGVDPRLVAVRGRPTVTKTRYRGGQHQLIRVDREHSTALPADAETTLIEEVEAAIEEADLVVLSDYSKGVLSDRVLAAAFAAAKKANKITLVDPKRTDLSGYRGATLIAPNRKELAAATGLPCETDQEAEKAAKAAMDASDAGILFKRSAKGVSLYRSGAPAMHMPAQAQEVYDVNGAGDTLVAGVALALAAGLPHEQALRLGNAAASVVVTKIGTTTVSVDELSEVLRRQGRVNPALPSPDALSTLQAACAQRDRWRAEGLVVGFTNGCFDLIHSGHISLIAQSAAACDRLIVALNADASIRRLKGPTRPVQALAARAAVMAGLKGVDLVVAFEEDTPVNLINALLPDVLVKGADYAEDEVVGGDIVKAHGGRVVLAELTKGQSTSALVEKAKL